MAQRTARCLGSVSDLLGTPLSTFPVDALSRVLASTFDVTGVFWSWRTAHGAFGIVVTPRSLRQTGDCWDLWEEGELFDIHPLAQWHLATHDASPQSASRVPAGMVRPANRQYLTGMLRPLGCEEQLSIACRCRGVQHETFVLARSAPDFSDDDLTVARNVQPALVSVHHQIGLFDRLGLGPSPVGEDLGLTDRERVVLRLLAEGHSARRIARYVAASPRTVEKHLEHIYRKMGVHDRLNAARLAQEMGLIGGYHSPDQ